MSSYGFKKLYDIDIKELLEQAIIVFDTSALLDLYFYSEATVLDVLEKSFHFFGKSRLFLPSQVMFEFDQNREKVIRKPIYQYDAILSDKSKNEIPSYERLSNEVNQFLDSFDKIIDKVNGQVKSFTESYNRKDRHPYLSEGVLEELRNASEEFCSLLTDIPRVNPFSKLKEIIEQDLGRRKSEIEARLTNDVVFEKLEEYFTHGRDYTFSELLEIATEGDKRYELKIPPGYMDSEKIGFQKYGDLFLWEQLLKYASQTRRPCIFVSNDIKEDWNDFQQTDDGKITKKTDSRKPRLELLLEFQERVGQDFQKLTLKDFIFALNEQFTNQFGSSTIEEIKLHQLRELVFDEAEHFIDTIESEIISEVKKSIVPPDEAVDYEIDYEDIYVCDLSVVSLTESSQTMFEYIVEVSVSVEMVYWEYWGRDDDTRERVFSPPGTVNYSGSQYFKIYRETEVDFENESIETISYEIELVTDDIEGEQESWGDKEDRGLNY